MGSHDHLRDTGMSEAWDDPQRYLELIEVVMHGSPRALPPGRSALHLIKEHAAAGRMRARITGSFLQNLIRTTRADEDSGVGRVAFSRYHWRGKFKVRLLVERQL